MEAKSSHNIKRKRNTSSVGDKKTVMSHKQNFNGKGSHLVITRLRPFGNSKGVILSNKLLESAGIDNKNAIEVYANKGSIIISQVKQSHKVNTDLSTWDKQFKDAIKNGALPDNDLFEGMQNDFDKTGW
jgi:antitoxin component of MazEF toxin-antitoxin module